MLSNFETYRKHRFYILVDLSYFSYQWISAALKFIFAYPDTLKRNNENEVIFHTSCRNETNNESKILIEIFS